MWSPQPGDLVGVKRLGVQGLVIESHEIPFISSPSGSRSGSARVLVEGEQRVYAWSDLFHIPTDDEADE